jgi:hypothetical protein
MEQACYDILLPVIEKASLLAAKYMKACERNTLTAMDLQYAMKYCARYEVGVDMGSIFTESESDSESDSDFEFETVNEEEEPFTRYTGEDVEILRINECFDTWESWEPTNPAESMLKDAINKNMY